jgi:hypothetical protein
VFLGLSGLARSALARDHDRADAHSVKGVVDFLFAVAAVGGDRPGWSAGSSGDPFDRRGKLWGAGRVALFDGEVQDHTVLVVSKLGLVTELDRLTPAGPWRSGGRPGRAG